MGDYTNVGTSSKSFLDISTGARLYYFVMHRFVPRTVYNAVHFVTFYFVTYHCVTYSFVIVPFFYVSWCLNTKGGATDGTLKNDTYYKTAYAVQR
jgi:hypothetical protein